MKDVEQKYPYGLQVVRKTYNGVTLGYVVGWWFTTRWGWHTGTPQVSFRSFRNGVIFKTEEKAKEFRNKVEKMRKDDDTVKFEEV